MASIRKRPDRPKHYEVVYRDAANRQRTKSFTRKTDAQAFKAKVEHERNTGTLIDANAGRVRFRDFAESWLAAQTFDASTREAVTSRLAVHLYPTFGDTELRSIRPSTVQAWLRSRQERCAPSTVRVLLANLSSILGAAVDDDLIAKNPCKSASVKAPALDRGKVEPWQRDRVDAVIAAHPDPYRAVPILAAGCGLRQGECFGVRVEDVDFLGRRLLVRQQVKLLGGRPTIAPPKGGRTREVPLPETVALALSERLRQYPVGEGGLVFTSRERQPLERGHFNSYVWKPALRTAGVEPTRRNGMHALRHHYASVLLDGGVSIRALADYLGHADPGFTLRTYTHLMPESEDRARQAVDAAFAREPGVSQDAL